ncbi:MAG: hypothetical protein JAY82_10990 [Candidatus Thiodiazotropha taylori]|nr:hypothetical protein [Candidatus Thiodiazotropha taylori]
MVGLIYLILVIPVYVVGFFGWKAVFKKDGLCKEKHEKIYFVLSTILISSVAYSLAATLFANSKRYGLAISAQIALVSVSVLFFIWGLSSITVYLRQKKPRKITDCFIRSILASISLIPICMGVYTDTLIKYLNIRLIF